MHDDSIFSKKINIDLQQDFGGKSKRTLAERFKENIKNFKLDEILKDVPPKKEYDLYARPLDTSGSMGGLSSKTIQKIWESGAFAEKFNDKTFSDKKIIIFDEMEKSSPDVMKKLGDLLNDPGFFPVMNGILDSRAEGTALADTFHQGAPRPVAVRRPLSLRAQAAAS